MAIICNKHAECTLISLVLIKCYDLLCVLCFCVMVFELDHYDVLIKDVGNGF